MATIGRFISPTKIKQEAFVDENVDEKYLSDTILYCQELYTKEVIGTGLYDQIKSQIEGGTLSSNNTTLLNSYLQPALKWWVIYEVMDMLYVKLTNKGVLIKKSDNSETVSSDYIIRLKDKFRNLAERWDQKTRLYLIENSSTFTLFNNPGTGADIIHPKNMVYDTGWYLGGTYNCSDIDEFDNPGTCCG